MSVKQVSNTTISKIKSEGNQGISQISQCQWKYRLNLKLTVNTNLFQVGFSVKSYSKQFSI